MKKIILTFLLIFFLAPDAFAKEYRFTKEINADILVEELREAGIILEGKDQIGYLNTGGGKILIITEKDIDKEKLTEIIENHEYVPPDQLEIERKREEKEKRDAAKLSARAKLKALGVTDEELDTIFE